MTNNTENPSENEKFCLFCGLSNKVAKEDFCSEDVNSNMLNQKFNLLQIHKFREREDGLKELEGNYLTFGVSSIPKIQMALNQFEYERKHLMQTNANLIHVIREMERIGENFKKCKRYAVGDGVCCACSDMFFNALSLAREVKG